MLNDKKIFMAVSALAVLCLGLFFKSVPVRAAGRLQPVGENVVIVIDPGHGGDNLGTESGHTLEKEMTLVTAMAMLRELELYDNVTVYLTHSDDRKMDLSDRAEFASGVGADFLFSIHYNASAEHTMFGSEVWVSCETPFNAYGYQFGYEYLLDMEEKGLFVRGVKTRIDKQKDYYGILREAAARSIPAVIIEHCHVDEERDAEYIKNEDDWAEFGRLDAVAVAKYFGLKSTALGVDYSENAVRLQDVAAGAIVNNTMQDFTPPDVCTIELTACDYDTGAVSFLVSAADYDSLLLYYDYSLDGGLSWSRMEPWPKCNALTRTYQDTFPLNLQIASGTQPNVILRAYNITDKSTESNAVHFDQAFTYEEASAEPDGAADTDEGAAAETSTAPGATELPDHSRKSIGTTTFMPAGSDAVEAESETSVVGFLKLCLILVVILFIIVLTLEAVLYRKRKRQRRNRK